MAVPPVVEYNPPAQDDRVTFSVICEPQRMQCGSFDDFCARASAASIDDILPDPAVLAAVSSRLSELGFAVGAFDPSDPEDPAEPSEDPYVGPVLIASGPVRLFEEVFRTHLEKVTMTSMTAHESSSVSSIVLARGADQPHVDSLKGALAVTLAGPPLSAMMPAAPGASPAFFSLPDGIAAATNAAACHQLQLSPQIHANGEGVKVAVLDNGFFPHSYFDGHDYHILRRTSTGAGDPAQEPRPHGSLVLANLLACAPAVTAYAVKYVDVNAGFARTLAIPGIRVISWSWYYDVAVNPMTKELLALEMQIRHAVARRRVTVVVASGNQAGQTFPALMPEVIAVGGVAFSRRSPDPSVWADTTSFDVPNRHVPDLCGIASEIEMPLPPMNGNPETMQRREGQTSCATPHVAGIAALLLQKQPQLPPSDVKQLLCAGATGVTNGQSFTGRPPAFATGAGLVNASNSWYRA